MKLMKDLVDTFLFTFFVCLFWFQYICSVAWARISNGGEEVETLSRILASMLSFMTRLRKAKIHTFVKNGSYITITVL